MKPLLVILTAITTAACFAEPIKMDIAQKKKLDTFFSNFSESHVAGFKQGALTEDAMLRFALSHLYINNLKSLKKTADGNSVIATTTQVDTATSRYFDRKIATHKKPSYTIPCASGETFTFSQIDTMEGTGNATFKATGTIYSTDSGATPDVHATPATWKKTGEEVTATGKFHALIKKLADRYVLIEYTPGEA